MVRSFRPALEVPKKLRYGATVCQFWGAQVVGAQVVGAQVGGAQVGGAQVGEHKLGSTRQMAGKVLVPQCSGPLPSVGATDYDHHLYKSNAFNRAGRSTTHFVGCIRYIEPKLSYGRSVLKVCVLFKSV